MKPCNFPGRRHERQQRAARRAAGEPYSREIGGSAGARSSVHPAVSDTCWRFGAGVRDPITGIPR